MGEMSPLNPALLGIAQRKSNVLLYVGGDSEVVICDNMSPGEVFVNGGTYSVTFR
jgi:hypothetical protein